MTELTLWPPRAFDSDGDHANGAPTVGAWFRHGQDWEPLRSVPAGNGVLAPGVTVVVCTVGRPLELHRFLESLEAQQPSPAHLIIVDASDDDRTERVVRDRVADALSAAECLYLRIARPLRGLTHQRNIALRAVRTDLVGFFDDDIVLLPDCLREMERVHRASGVTVVGVGAYILNEFSKPTGQWLLRVRVGVVPNLEPGRYHPSGMSTPWSFLPPTDEVVAGDWLRGCAMMWQTAPARACRFYEGFGGYAQGEDLDFSLRMRKQGTLVVAGRARALHLHASGGRPAPFRHGYMEIWNRYEIHRRDRGYRSGGDRIRFAYAWTLDTLLLTRHLLVPFRTAAILKRLA